MKYHDKIEYQNLISIIEGVTEGDGDKAFQELKELAIKENDLVGMAAINFYSVMELAEINPEKTIELADRALSYAIAGNSEYFVLRAYNSLGIDYSEKADYFKSMHYYIKAYHIAIKHVEFNFEPVILNNIGNLFVWLKDYETAINFIETAYEQASKTRETQRESFLAQVVLNIIELYSYLEEFSKVDYWKKANVEIDDGRLEILEIIYLMNEMVEFTGSQSDLICLIKKYLARIKDNTDYIYIFRSLLKIFDLAIHKGNQEICEVLIEVMRNRREKTNLAMYDLYFYDSLYEYDIKFKNMEPNKNFASYYQTSRRISDILKTVCSKNLMMEIELDNIKNQKEDILVKRTILLEKVKRDPFTQLYNKVFLSERITEDIKKNRYYDEKTKVTLFFIDIDYFKEINDTLGHQKGDEILLQIASKLLEFKNENTLIGRYGGDEFLIYLNGEYTVDTVEKMVQDVFDKLSEIKISLKDMKHIMCSIGVIISDKDRTFKELLKLADSALYQVKENGRNNYIIVEDNEE